MNKIKVIIIVVAITLVAVVGVTIALTQLGKSKEIALPKSHFTTQIEKEIEQLKTKSDNTFCKDFYKQILSEIVSFHTQNRFGETINTKGEKSYSKTANDQWKEDLEKTLYSVYAEKFIKQAKTVFRGSVWRPEDLLFIQAEKNELKKSKLLDPGSPVDKEFNTIQMTLNKYNEILDFIFQCKNFGYSGTVVSEPFPIANVQNKIQRANSLLNNHMENDFVNNCIRLHDGLKEIPQELFQAHIRYLENKINYWSNMWCNYNSHSDYSNNLNKPLKQEITDLSNSNIYSGVNVDNECMRLYNKWSLDNQRAYNATYPCNY